MIARGCTRLLNNDDCISQTQVNLPISTAKLSKKYFETPVESIVNYHHYFSSNILKYKSLVISRCSRSSKFVTHENQLRTISTMDKFEHKALIIKEFGEPSEKVLLEIKKSDESPSKELGPKQILVQHLAACINPSDIYLIKGVYDKNRSLPSVVGLEGIMRVIKVGSDVNNLKPGDHGFSLPFTSYWQSYSVQESETFFKIDSDLDVTTAAQLKVNPCTAYRMLKDFGQLRPGDVVLQNGANSAVGIYVAQLAKHWGFKTINVIRDRPNKAEVISELKGFGADFVVTEEELRDVEVIKPIIDQIGKPKLCLNCVGGKNAVDCHRILEEEGTSVTYGLMSKQPLLSGAQFIFKDHILRSFWMSRWYKKRDPTRRDEIRDMLDEVAGMFKSGILKPKPSTLISFEDRNIAFSGSSNTKYIFSINQ